MTDATGEVWEVWDITCLEPSKRHRGAPDEVARAHVEWMATECGRRFASGDVCKVHVARPDPMKEAGWIGTPTVYSVHLEAHAVVSPVRVVEERIRVASDASDLRDRWWWLGERGDRVFIYGRDLEQGRTVCQSMLNTTDSGRWQNHGATPARAMAQMRGGIGVALGRLAVDMNGDWPAHVLRWALALYGDRAVHTELEREGEGELVRRAHYMPGPMPMEGRVWVDAQTWCECEEYTRRRAAWLTAEVRAGAVVLVWRPVLDDCYDYHPDDDDDNGRVERVIATFTNEFKNTDVGEDRPLGVAIRHMPRPNEHGEPRLRLTGTVRDRVVAMIRLAWAGFGT